MYQNLFHETIYNVTLMDWETILVLIKVVFYGQNTTSVFNSAYAWLNAGLIVK